MKPTAPFRTKFSVFATTPCRGLSPSRYQVCPRKDKRGVDLISDALPFGALWYTEATDGVEYAKFYSRSHHAVIRV